MISKRILFLISSLGSGGAERQTIDLINRMDQNRFVVSLTYFVRNETLKHLIKEENLAGLYCLNKKMRFDFGSLMRLKDIIQRDRPDTVVCVNLYPLLYAHILRFLFGQRFSIIAVMHSTVMPDRYNDLLVRLIYKPLLNRSERVIFVCRNQMEYWIQHYHINDRISSFIYNGIDTNFFDFQINKKERAQIRSSLGILYKENVICICATINKVKRHHDLIDAISLLINKNVHIKSIIVGDGPELEKIKKYADLKKLKDVIVFVGFQPDVRPFLALSDIFVLCSSTETFSIAVLEAMAMGKAIVAPAIGGIPEQVFDGKNGLLFPLKNVETLAENIEHIIINNCAESMGNLSKKIVNEEFTANKMVCCYENLLENSG